MSNHIYRIQRVWSLILVLPYRLQNSIVMFSLVVESIRPPTGTPTNTLGNRNRNGA